MKSKKVMGLLFILFTIIISKSGFAMDGTFIKNIDREIHELDLNQDGISERVEIIRKALTSSYISYYIYDSVTEEILFSRENLYRGIVQIKFNSIIEKLPIYNEEYFGSEDYYEEREYILEDDKVVCISNVTRFKLDLADQERLGVNSTEYYENPPRSEIESILEEVALNKGIPPTILKAIAYTESNYRQFYYGKPLLSFDGVSWGVMQVTPKFYPDLDIEKLKYDIRYNIEAGADILLGKWGYGFGTNPIIPKIGDGDIRVLEDWYFAIWAYNGWSESNNPNMIPYKHSSWIQNEAYQDKVLRHAKEILGQEIVPIPKSLLPSTGKPDSKVRFNSLINSKADKYRLFVENQTIKVATTSGLKLRNDKMEYIKAISNGQNLRILGAPILYDGYYRYKVQEIYNDGSTGKIGWVANNWILPNDKMTKGILVWQKRIDIANKKTWTISFNLDVDKSSISNTTVYIEDSNGNQIDLSDFKNDNKVLKITPLDPLKSGEKYILWIKGVKATEGNGLIEYVQMAFVVE